MKKLVFIVIACISFACSGTNKQSEEVVSPTAIRDSIARLIMDSQIKGNPESLEKALALNDQLLDDKNVADKQETYANRVQILALQGKNAEAFKLRSRVINQDPMSIERLVYNGQYAKLREKEDSANYYFATAIDECNKLLKDGMDVNVIFSIVDIYMFQNKDKEAMKLIEEAIGKDPENEVLSAMREQYPLMKAQSEAFFGAMNFK